MPGPPDPRTWARINDLFHEALERPEAERDAFVTEAAGGDAALRAEVSSLLAAHARAGSFIAEPAAGVAAARSSVAAAAASMAGLASGQELGPYRIARQLGIGGMGEVYLAEDSRLGRLVALKALAPEFTGDPARRERLRREARAAGALTHPGIATIYALEEIDGHVYIASEYVEGLTLRDEFARGPLATARAIDTGLQLAHALAAAHERGIIHRDLKPENIIRTPSGIVKILDFGLARVEGSGVPPPALTAEGVAIGTPAYMSPEQIRGEAVDARSDLFALGIVLYEAVAGRNPFLGVDAAGTLARVLEHDPEPFAVQEPTASDAAVRAAFEAVVRRCLQRARDRRFASATDVADALERARAGLVSAPHAALTPGGPVAGPGRAHAWWQFHQGTASVAYTMLLLPLWFARPAWPPPWGSLLFVLGVAASIAASTMRLHLWFTAREYPAEWPEQRRGLGGWLRLADLVFVAILAITGLSAASTAPGTMALMVASAVAVLLSALVIEPATTRAAFGDESTSGVVLRKT
jgi:hypothetical protein